MGIIEKIKEKAKGIKNITKIAKTTVEHQEQLLQLNQMLCVTCRKKILKFPQKPMKRVLCESCKDAIYKRWGK